MNYRLLVLVMFGLVLAGAAYATADGQTGHAPRALDMPDLGARVPQVAPSLTLPPTVTPTNSPPPPPPSETPTATGTPGPIEYVIKAGDTCLGIAMNFGHVHPQVKDAIEALNGIPDCTILPGPGSTILVPRPTFTPTMVGGDLTETAVATSAPPNLTIQTGPSFSVQAYAVQDGDTLSSIAIGSDSSLRQLCELNPLPDGLNCSGCTWESPHCCCPNPPVLSVGQQINVPAPTPTPTFTPTFTGSETPTPTPTYRAPNPVYPPSGATVAGAVRLTWLSVGVLGENEYFLVTLRDETTGAGFNGTTQQLSLAIPAEYLPSDGQTHTFGWQVSVATFGADGLLYPMGGVLAEQRFTWTGW